MKILIVEDEMIISEDIAMILESQGYEITDQVIDYDDAMSSMSEVLPDLALLDINLAGEKTGIDIARSINDKYHFPFIYTSSLGSSKAISKAKATNPAAYLVKPFREEQLLAAIEVAMANYAKEDAVANDDESVAMFNDSIFIKVNHRFVKLLINDIIYIKKSDNYIEIYANDTRYLVRASISGFLEKLSFEKMFRTHKSYAINLDYVKDISPKFVNVNDHQVPLAKTYSDTLKKHFRLF